MTPFPNIGCQVGVSHFLGLDDHKNERNFAELYMIICSTKEPKRDDPIPKLIGPDTHPLWETHPLDVIFSFRIKSSPLELPMPITQQL